MAAQNAKMDCQLYRSAFSGELVYGVKTAQGEIHEGVTPKGFADPKEAPVSGAAGAVVVRLISNGGKSARVSAPDGEILDVPTKAVHVAD